MHVSAEMPTFAVRCRCAVVKNLYKVHNFYTGIDLVTAFALPWIGVAVGWVLCWLWMTVRRGQKRSS